MAEYRRITTLVNIFLQEIVNLSVVCIYMYIDIIMMMIKHIRFE